MESEGTVLPKELPKISPGSSIRKLKQSRLPFQVLTAADKSLVDPVETRKRKPSSEELDLGHVAKAGRISEAKENVTSSKKSGIMIDDLDENDSKALMDSSLDVVAGCSNNDCLAVITKKQSKTSAANRKNSGKIIIKLPVGPRKHVISDQSKPISRKNKRIESLNLYDPECSTIVLDDSDLSDDQGGNGEKNENKESVLDSPTEIRDNEISEQITTLRSSMNAKIKNPLNDHSSFEEQAQEAMGISSNFDIIGTKCDDLLLSMKSYQTDKSSDGPTSSPLKMIPNCTSSDQSMNVAEVDKSTDVDSSEDDIYMLCTPNPKIVPTDDELRARKLTPKQIARRQEYERKQELKQHEKQEKLRKLQVEKQEKAKEKEEQERLRKKEREEKEEQKRREREEKEEIRRKDREEKEEQKRKEREEREEQKRKDREEKEKKRQAELEQRNEEKRMKEEERRKKEGQREEDRKRKEEEKEAEEKRKQKVAQAFSNFFVKKAVNGSGGKASDDENSVEYYHGGVTSGMSVGRQRFMPFCIKGDMRLAPVIRRVLDPMERNSLEKILDNIGEDEKDSRNLYLNMLKRKCHKPLKTGRTYNTEEEEENDEIMIVDDDVCHHIEADPGKMKQKFRTKFLLFDENRRPPYRGTWRKQSSCIKARRPFAQDTKFFDYDVDSDDEWEEEEPGESLHGSDEEKDVDPEEDYEIDNEFFVPHGHLSDEELNADEENEIDNNSPEAQKVKLKIMQQEFVAEMSKKTERIKPRLIGCIWENDIGDSLSKHQQDSSRFIWKMLNDLAMLYNPDDPISFTRSFSSSYGNDVDVESDSLSPSKENEKTISKKIRITDDAISDLVRLVHGNTNNRKFLVREFHAFWMNRNKLVEFSLESISNKIKELSTWGACDLEGPMFGKHCWTVKKNVLEKYCSTELKLPNDWKYQLEKTKQNRIDKKKSEKIEEDVDRQLGLVKKIDQLHKRPYEEANRPTKEIGSVSPEVGSIAKFTKLLTKDERLKGFNITNSAQDVGNRNTASIMPNVSEISIEKDVLKSTATEEICNKKDSLAKTKSKKRVQLLMSVPRNQAINQATKNNLISKFLAKNTRTTMSAGLESEKDTICEVMESN